MNLSAIASLFAVRLCAILNLDKNLIPVYAYGLELLLAAILNILLIFFATFLFHVPYAGVFFLLSFIPLRVTAGGFHASTHFRCTLVCMAVFVLTIALTRCIHDAYRPIVSMALCLFDLATIICLSPVEAIQKPLTASEHRINRSRSLFLAILFCAVSALSLNHRFTSGILFFPFGVFSAAISQIAGKIQSIIEGRRTRE